MTDADDLAARFGRRADELGRLPAEWVEDRPWAAGADPAGEDPDAGTTDDRSTDPPFVPPTIVCVDCGGTCHLMTPPYEDADGGAPGFRPGDVVAYRCADCLDRWDLVVE